MAFTVGSSAQWTRVCSYTFGNMLFIYVLSATMNVEKCGLNQSPMENALETCFNVKGNV